MENFILNVKDEIISSFKQIPSKYFDLYENFTEPLGKGVRTRFAFWLSRALGADLKYAVKIASAAEIVHMASLLHDDCVDSALTRRGNASINFKYGINRAILVGDLVVSIAFKKAKSVSCDLALSLVDCVENMSKGALLEENIKFKVITESDYSEVVDLKTSSLFRWISFSIGAVSGFNDFVMLDKISKNFGLSFQIIDDIIDIEGDESLIGKDSFKDLVEGKINYPVLLGLKDDYVKTRTIGFFEDKKDIVPVYEIRKHLVENKYTDLAREKALNLVLDLKDDILKLKKQNEAIDFFNFIYSMCERKK